jgi:hypothetical protein
MKRNTNKRGVWARKSLSPTKVVQDESQKRIRTDLDLDPPEEKDGEELGNERDPPPLDPPPQQDNQLKVNIVNSVVEHVRLEKIDYAGIVKLKNYYIQQSRTGVEVNVWNCLDLNLQRFLTLKAKDVDLENLGDQELIDELFIMFPEKAEYRDNLSLRVQQLVGTWDEYNTDIQDYTYKLFSLWDEQPPTEEEDAIAVKEIIKTLNKSKIPFQRNVARRLSTMKPFAELKDFVKVLIEMVEEFTKAKELIDFFAPNMIAAKSLQVFKKPSEHTDRSGARGGGKQSTVPNKLESKKCYNCGEVGHIRPLCPKKKTGNSLLPFSDSNDLVNRLEDINVKPSKLIKLNIF